MYMKRLMILALALLMLLPAAYAEQEDMYFPEPVDGILYFADCLKNQDVEGAALSMAAQSVAARFDLQKYLNRVRLLTPSMPNPFPGDNPQHLRLNAQVNRANNIIRVQRFLSSLALPGAEEMQQSGMIPMNEDGLLTISKKETLSLEEYTARFDPAYFSPLELKALYENITPVMEEERAQQIYIAFGAEEGREYLAVYAFQGQLFQHSYTAVKYPEGWQVLFLHAPVTGTSPRGTAETIDQQTLDDLDANPNFAKVYPAE